MRPTIPSNLGDAGSPRKCFSQSSNNWKRSLILFFINVGKNQQAAKKSVVPSFNEAGGLRPLTVNLPQQQQNAQGYPQPQSQPPQPLDANPALNPAQMPFGDQPEATDQAPPAAQPFAPVPAESEAVSQGPVQNPQQALDQAQGGVPQSFQQGFYPQAAEPSEMQIPGAQNMTAAFPMSKWF